MSRSLFDDAELLPVTRWRVRAAKVIADAAQALWRLAGIVLGCACTDANPAKCSMCSDGGPVCACHGGRSG